jgi:SAM-dependent methyltransferase
MQHFEATILVQRLLSYERNGKQYRVVANVLFYGPWQDVQLAGYPEEQTQAEVAFMISALHLDAGARILDVPCGQGRHSIAFAKAGFKATGIDFNANAIEQARKAAADQGIAAEFAVADMREFSWTHPFDAAFCFYGSFGYFDDARTFVSRRVCVEALRPGGRFLIDVQIAESLFPKFRERDWHWVRQDPPLRILEERRWSLESGSIESTWSFIGRHQFTVYGCGFILIVNCVNFCARLAFPIRGI